MRVFVSALAAALIAGCASVEMPADSSTDTSPDTIILSAKAGNYDLRYLGSAARKTAFSTSVKLRSFNSGNGFPTLAQAGFQQSDRKNFVAFFLAHVHPKDPYLSAGYRVVEQGKETKVEFLSYLRNLQMSMRVSLSFDNGIATIRINDLEPEVVRTAFSEVTPFLMASSSKAEFKIDPSLRDLK